LNYFISSSQFLHSDFKWRTSNLLNEAFLLY